MMRPHGRIVSHGARVLTVAVLLALLAAPGVDGKEPKNRPPAVIDVDGPRQPPLPPPDPVPDVGFPVGEQLVYGIYWGVVPVGEAHAWTEWDTYEGRPVLAIRFRTRSNKVLSAMYPVDDFIESLVEPSTFRTLRFIKKINEGSNHYDQVTTFDHEKHTAHWLSKLDDREHVLEIEPGTLDMPTLMYSLRKRDFAEGEKAKFVVLADEKVYELNILCEKVETIKAAGRKVPSLKMEPQAAFNGVFVSKGRMWVWVSRDTRRILTRMSIEVPVGRVHLNLKTVTGPGDDAWVREAKD